jgi:opacity protein-like surface antigen
LPERFGWMHRVVRPNPQLESILQLSEAKHRLFMSVSLSELYSDNFERTEHDREDEYRTSLSLGTTYRLQQKRSFVSLSNSISAAYEARSEDSNIGFFNLSLNAGHQFQHLALGINESFVRSDDLSLTSSSGVRRERQTTTTNRVTPQLQITFNPRTAMTLAYTNTLVFYDDDPDDTITHAVTTGLQHHFSQRLSGSAGYAYSNANRSETDDRQSHQLSSDLSYRLNRRTSGTLQTFGSTTLRDGGDDSRTYGMSIGVRRQLTPDLGLFVALGPTVFDRQNDNMRVYANAQVNLDGPIFRTRHTTVSLSFNQTVSDTTSGVGGGLDAEDNVGIVLRQSAALTLNHSFSRRLRTALLASATRSDFLEDPDSEDADSGDVLFWHAGARAAYALTRILDLALNYQYQQRIADDSGNDFEAHQVRLTLSAGIPIF